MPPIRFPLTDSLDVLIHDQSRGLDGYNQLDTADRVMLGQRQVDPFDSQDPAARQATDYLRSVLKIDSWRQVRNLRGAAVVYQLRRAAYDAAARNDCETSDELLLTSNSLAIGLGLPAMPFCDLPLVGLYVLTAPDGSALRSIPAASAHHCVETFRPTTYLGFLVPLNPADLGLD